MIGSRCRLPAPTHRVQEIQAVKRRLVTGILLLVATMASGVLLVACGGDDDVQPTPDSSDPDAYHADADKDALFLIRMDNFNYIPSTLEVNAGDVIALAIQNDVSDGHDFTIDADIHFALTERGSGVVHIKVHQPGTYEFYCSLPDHREEGMVGTLIVN